MIKVIISVLLIIGLVCLAAHASERVRIDSYYAPDHLIVVPVRVNKKYKAFFLLDTGASISCLSESFAKTIPGLKVLGEIETTTANGIAKSSIVEVDLIEVGPVDRKHPVVGIVKFPPNFPYGGLIGRDLLQKIQVTDEFIYVD